MMNEKPMWKTEEKQLEKYDENQHVAVSCELVEERQTCCKGWSTVSEAMEEKVPEIKKKRKKSLSSSNLTESQKNKTVLIIDWEKKPLEGKNAKG